MRVNLVLNFQTLFSHKDTMKDFRICLKHFKYNNSVLGSSERVQMVEKELAIGNEYAQTSIPTCTTFHVRFGGY